MTRHENFSIRESKPLLSPLELTKQLPLTDTQEEKVLKFREEIRLILDGQSHKKLLIVGPCQKIECAM